MTPSQLFINYTEHTVNLCLCLSYTLPGQNRQEHSCLVVCLIMACLVPCNDAVTSTVAIVRWLISEWFDPLGNRFEKTQKNMIFFFPFLKRRWKKQRERDPDTVKDTIHTTNTAPLEPQNKVLKYCLMSL